MSGGTFSGPFDHHEEGTKIVDRNYLFPLNRFVYRKSISSLYSDIAYICVQSPSVEVSKEVGIYSTIIKDTELPRLSGERYCAYIMMISYQLTCYVNTRFFLIKRMM